MVVGANGGGAHGNWNVAKSSLQLLTGYVLKRSGVKLVAWWPQRDQEAKQMKGELMEAEGRVRCSLRMEKAMNLMMSLIGHENENVMRRTELMVVAMESRVLTVRKYGSGGNVRWTWILFASRTDVALRLGRQEPVTKVRQDRRPQKGND